VALSLGIYPERRETPLAAHKSMNYLYYALAGSYAKAQGDDEALILNGDGSVSETNTCALIAVKGRRLFFPESNFALPSVTFSAAVDLFSEGGYDMVPVKMMPEDLKRGAFGAVYLLNALMGAVPVCAIDGLPLVGHGGGATPWDAGKNSMIEERKLVGSAMERNQILPAKSISLCAFVAG
jgi:para-aminobenzoate synthetase component 1